MPAMVTTDFLGNPEMEQTLRARVEQFFKRYLDNWTVSILGAQDNDVWKFKITAPDGRELANEFHAHDGGHDIEKIMAVVERITMSLRSERAASGAA